MYYQNKIGEMFIIEIVNLLSSMELHIIFVFNVIYVYIIIHKLIGIQ